MQRTKLDIITILKGYLSHNYDFEISSNFNDILNTANSLNLSPIIGYTLNKTSKYKNNIFDNVMYITAIKYEKQEHYRSIIKELFESHNIEFAYIKGNTLAKYYDEKSLRISSDIDILVNKKDYEYASNLLKTECGFKEYCYAENEQALVKDNIYIDLQNKLTNNDEIIDKIYADIKLDDSHELSNEHKYLLIVSHAAKHLLENYISLPFLLDLYYVNKLELDRTVIPK